MIWLKRLAPLIALAVIWFGYKQFQARERKQQQAEMHQKATIVAHLWLAAAGYRTDPPRYEAFRDSLLSANQLTKEELQAFSGQFADDPNANVELMNLVSKAADSLYPKWDSLWRANALHPIAKPQLDSLLADSASAVPVDSIRGE